MPVMGYSGKCLPGSVPPVGSLEEMAATRNPESIAHLLLHSARDIPAIVPFSPTNLKGRTLPISQMRKLSSERLSGVPKVTQTASLRAGT